jgi:hypothetical protein
MGDGQDLMRRIASASERIDPGLSERDVERLVAGAQRRRGRRATVLRAVLAAGATAALAMTGALVVHRARYAPEAQLATAPDGVPPVDTTRILRLPDGSTAVPLDP